MHTSTQLQLTINKYKIVNNLKCLAPPFGGKINEQFRLENTLHVKFDEFSGQNGSFIFPAKETLRIESVH